MAQPEAPRSARAHAQAAWSLVFLCLPFHLSHSSPPHALAASWLSDGKSMRVGPDRACSALVTACWLCVPLQGGR